MSRLTAGASGHVLMKALKRAGWGNLAGAEFRGVRGVYSALVDLLDPKSSQGKATAWQIAEHAGYTERWTRRCLHVLEELELIEWQRGGVVDGKPVPSWFRVSKRALLVLVSIARTAAAERQSEQQNRTRERIARYRLHRTTGRRKRRSVHAEVSTALLSIEEVPRDAGPPVAGPAVSGEDLAERVASVRARIRSARGVRPVGPKPEKPAPTTRGGGNRLPGLSAAMRSRLNTYAPVTGGIDQ